jgi:hypothetical protein
MPGIADLVGWLSFAFYLFVVIGISAVLAGLIGAGLRRRYSQWLRWRNQRATS